MAKGEIEANAHLVRSADGWRVQFVFDDGTCVEQEQPPFATKEEADAALQSWIDEHDIRTVAKPQ